ncbi:MAG: CpsD/CapB family tyrosine-protein kinase [Ruminococcaceae bacterium]|nr:CpsD/CapB family tyrosine-protein kinase [Oscillospiraceae bacterium]
MPGDKSLLFTNPDIGSGFPESFRVLRNVFVSSLNENEKIIMTTSSVPGEGKTTIATNLAIALADHSKKILLVDGDIRHPSVAPLLGVDLKNIEYETVTDLYKIAYLEKYKLHILIPTPAEDEQSGYFSSANIKQMFKKLRDSYDYIIVDTPPCGLISDALFIAQYADAAIFITYQDAVRISRVKNTLDSLMSTDIRILGCVLNGTVQGFSGYGYYGYGYGYGYGKYGYGYGYGKYGYGYGYGENHKHKRKRRHRSSKRSETKQ